MELNFKQRLQKVRCELQAKNLKKSGENKFANFKYYELADFIPQVNKLFLENNLTSNFSVVDDLATLTIEDCLTDAVAVFTSPIADATVKGCTPIQGVGALHTYMKRYLYLNALEIVENDLLDASVGKEQEKATEKQVQILSKNYTGANLEKLLKVNNITKLEDLPKQKASELISKIYEKGN